MSATAVHDVLLFLPLVPPSGLPSSPTQQHTDTPDKPQASVSFCLFDACVYGYLPPAHVVLIVERENVACRVCAAHPQEEWGQWSQPSEPFRTLPEGAKQPTAPAVKLREAGALVVRLPKGIPKLDVSAATCYRRF